MQTADLHVSNTFLSIHWATLIQGAERAHKADPNGRNSCVQMSLIGGLSRCKLYSRRMPDDCVVYLIELGNSLNDKTTSTTILEKWRSTAKTEPQWAAKRKSMNWSTTAMASKVRDEKKFTFICTLHKHWSTYHAYEVCNTFYKESCKVMVDTGGGGEASVWALLSQYIQENVDLPSMTMASDERTMHLAMDVLRALRSSHSEWIVPIIALSLPLLGGVGPAQCLWMPNGLPLIAAVSQGALDGLLTKMDGAKTLADALLPQRKGKRQRKSSSSAGIVATQQPDDSQCDPDANAKTTLEHLDDTIKYLMKIDDRQEEKIKAFKSIAVYAALQGTVVVNVKGATKKIDRWSTLRQMMKDEVYRAAELKPRASDVDALALADLVQDGREAQATVNTGPNTELLNDLQVFASDMYAYTEQHKVLELPIVSSLSVATAVNSTMLALFTAVASKGGRLSSKNEATALLVDMATDQVMTLLPDTWSRVASAVGDLTCARSPAIEAVAAQFTPFDKLMDKGFLPEVFFAMRFQTLAHILASLGLQQCSILCAVTSQTALVPYLDARMHKCFAELAIKYDVALEPVRKSPPRELFDCAETLKKSFKELVRLYANLATEGLAKAISAIASGTPPGGSHRQVAQWLNIYI